MATVLITGTGLIAAQLAEKLTKKGYNVTFLSRGEDPSSPYKIYTWDIKKQKIDAEAIANADYIVHLAGSNIAEQRWTKERKKIIVDSRVDSSNLLFSEIKKQKKALKAFITASGVGYYGAVTTDKIFSENDIPATDFLGITCKKWEKSTIAFQKLGIRTVIIRTGIVLAKKDSALDKMLTPIKMGIGSPIGSGKQYMPWIHIDDICNIYIKAIEDINMHGAYNSAASDQKNNEEFLHTIAKVLHKPFWFPSIPSFAIRILFGEMADILLKGSRVSNKKLLQSGFQFQFNDLKKALEDLLLK
jgi:uncharacterized protein (TIGR01777 family)